MGSVDVQEPKASLPKIIERVVPEFDPPLPGDALDAFSA
jgi:hypothetical protein